MKISRTSGHASRGFTLVESLITTTIVTAAIGLSLSTYMFGLRTMYKDNQRLATNANLRQFTAQVAKETLDATEFYLFPTYESLDGSVNLATDVSVLEGDAYGTEVAHGDCLVLVTRLTLDSTSNIRQFRIYYRTVKTPHDEGAIRYYRSPDYTVTIGAEGNPAALTTLLNAINLKATPAYAGTSVLAATARGRGKPSSTTECYPIFSTETPGVSATNESVSINVEIINGTSVNNLLSSSSFNYTISPRR